MELTYRQSGDYLLPNLTMEAAPEEPMGKYGRMRKSYLKAHQKGMYNELLLSDQLTQHLLEVDRLARDQIERIIAKMAEAEGVTEELKAADPMRWVGLMNNFKHTAEEIVLRDLVYS